MGTFAARLGDPTVHGGAIVQGFPTVIIGGMPASRIGDMHACPMVTVIVPHVGGPLILGSFTVITGFSPQSRLADMLICIGPPDVVAMGCPTVIVGMAGGGMGLGAILAGLAGGLGNMLAQYPRAVLAADGSVVTEYSPAITIQGTPLFQATMISRLNQIASTTSGAKTLQQINGSGKSMKIVEYTGDNSFCGANNTWKDLAGQTAKGQPVFDGNGNPLIGPDGKTQLVGTGTGADTTLQMNPNLTLPNSNDPNNPMPNDAVMMHEMTHGAHQMNGNADMSPAPDGWTTNEEKNTISGPEADYLQETGYPDHRTDHDLTFAPNNPAPDPDPDPPGE